MRRILLVVVLAAVGCGGGSPSTQVGGKSVSHWVQALQDRDPRVRKKAVDKLGNVGTADPAVVPALIQALKDRDAGVRAEAVLRLLQLGPAARDAVPALAEAQKDADATVRDHAARALERIQGHR
jgi:HEAT repeat protein